ncbi:MAG: hypothetical protein ABSF59_05600 [Candidatus Sulfotelmatobacter sp.]
MQLGFESRKKAIAAGALGVLLVLVLVYEVSQFSSTTVATAPVAPAANGLAEPGTGSAKAGRAAPHKGTGGVAAKKERAPQNLDPTLHLRQLAATEQINYEGSGRNIFVSQAETEIPKPLAPGQTDPSKVVPINFQPPPPPPPPPIPLKFFGFADQVGEPKKVFLSKDDDVFIAGEGEIVDRRYKVVRISPTSVEIQDVVGSGPPQSIPLSQG